MKIPMVDLKVQYHNYKEEFDRAVIDVMESCAFIMGPEVSALETEMAQYLGSKYALGVASGTDALLLALQALGIGKGDKVLVPNFTFIATSEVVSRVGADPILVDIEPDTFCMDPVDAERKITPDVKAMIPVHLYGQAADMDRLTAIAKKYNLYIVEDCAQATGATWKGKKVGTFGNLGCFSFFPSKNLGGYGDGGMIFTDDEQLARKIKALRNHGSYERYYHVMHGYNSRLDSMQAAILRVKLRHLDEWNDMRRRAAARYTAALNGTCFTPPFERDIETSKHVYHQYTIKTPKMRDELQKYLASKDVASMLYYPVPLHMQEVYADLGYKQGDFPVSEKVVKEVISLPIFPDLTDEQVDYVVEMLKQFAKENNL